MASAIFDAYDKNLRRVYLAEFVDNCIQTNDIWHRRASPRAALITDAGRAEMRSKLLFGVPS